MIYDILEVFKKEYEKSGDGLILGSYTLKDGLYVKINKDNTLEFFESKTVKREKLFTALDGIQNSEVLDWFKQNDYYSSYINSNKSLFDKKIHNINYLSYFFKLENSDYVKDKIDEHFNILLDFGKFKDKKDKEVLESYQDRLKSEDRKKDILAKSEILKNRFDEIIEVANSKEIKNYIKIFFDEDLKTYKEESEIYLSLKIFNDSSYNQKIEDSIFGLSNSNMGLNSKKPFLENKTRKFSAPFLLKNEDALILKKFFDWLKIQPYNQDRTLDEEHFFLQKHSSNDEAEITDFDYIPTKKDDVNKYFLPIYVKNYLELENKDKKLISDYEIKELWQLEDKVDELFYNKQLKFNYYGDVNTKLNNKLISLLYITRNAMINYFKKYDEEEFYQVVKKYGTNFVIEHLRQNLEYKAKESLNLKISLLKHKGENIMNIKSIQEEMIKKLEVSDYEGLKSEEFFYLCGQVASYLLSKKNQHEKMHDLVEPFLRANNAQKLKKEIEFAFFQYKHAIHFGAKKINNAIALIEAYEGEEKLSYFRDSFLIGYLSNAHIFKSTEESK
jgi:CRISPR-associated protein Csh1